MNKSRVINVKSGKIYNFDSLGESLLFFYSLVKDNSWYSEHLHVQVWDDSQEEGEKWISPCNYSGDLWKKD